MAAALGLIALAVLAGCDAILGIPGTLEVATGGSGGSGGKGGAGGSGASGGTSPFVLRESRLATAHQVESSDGAAKVTLHLLDSGQRTCDETGKICIRGGLTTQGADKQ